jgi:hypothetical protein
MDVSEKITGEEGDGILRLMKIKLPRKKDALEALGRHLQLFNDKPEAPNDDWSNIGTAIAEALAQDEAPGCDNAPDAG